MIASTHTVTEDSFETLSAHVHHTFGNTLQISKSPLFTTDADNLNDIYLAFLPSAHRQHHTCSCCRHFLQRFGGLVVITEDGSAVPAMWNGDDAPELYRLAVREMERAVRKARVTGVFLCEDEVMGTPEAGGFTHFWTRTPAISRHRRVVLTAKQAMAAKREDHRTLSHGLADFGPDLAAAALNLVKSDALYRSEKVLGPATFFHELHQQRGDARGERARNIVWRAVATAPVSFCTPRSTMIGTLLEDLKEGLPIDVAKRRFASKMSPLQYQRPQAAPSAGAVAAAEKIAAQMNLAPALARRFARIEDCQLVWSPSPVAEGQKIKVGGVFSDLTVKEVRVSPNISAADGTPRPITWEKFARTVLPDALTIDVFTTGSMNLCQLVTAVNPDAIPIMQWDFLWRRNPVNWYVYPHGSPPSRFGLPMSQWVPVTGVTLQPSMWHGGCEHQGTGVVFLMQGAADQNDGGLGLFPEVLRSELHQVRAVIEAYSRKNKLAGREQSTAAGLMVATSGRHASEGRIRVRTGLGTTVYTIDRWD